MSESHHPPHLAVRALKAGYERMTVVSDISFDVDAGTLTVMVGRNGSGKTTSLLAVAGIRYGPGKGSVVVDGEELYGHSAAEIVRAGLALVPEGHRIFPSMSVEENLIMGAYPTRPKRRDLVERKDRVFDLFPLLREHATRVAGGLSGGGQQMISIGQALMSNPRVLLLDEPASGLAPGIVLSIYDAIRQLCDAGLAVLVVEQDISRAMAQGDTCYVIDRGRVALSGACSALASNPKVANIIKGSSGEEMSPALA